MARLDFKTKLYLKLLYAKIVDIEPNVEVGRVDPKEVYVFTNYDEYVEYFNQYLKRVDDELIELAIITRGKKGQIVAQKGLVERIIIKQRTREFYDRYNLTKIEEIHSRGKQTPMDKIKELESQDLCIVGDAIGSARHRCKFFENCHECLEEALSHQEEYDYIDFKIVNREINNEKKLIRK